MMINGQDLVTLGSAAAAAALALMPAYQKWREIRRSQDAADHEAGVDAWRDRVQPALKRSLGTPESLCSMLLAVVLLGGLIHNAYRAERGLQIIQSQMALSRQTRELIDRRYDETLAQRREYLEVLRRIEAAVVAGKGAH